jgi:hypothetical protein|eukprot:COSAG01_NODE_1217_length_11190_cov_69.180417_9_plen_41_part_00
MAHLVVSRWVVAVRVAAVDGGLPAPRLQARERRRESKTAT